MRLSAQAKNIIKLLTPPLLFDATKQMLRGGEPAERYLNNGAVAWSPGYEQYKRNQIAKVLSDQELLALFRNDNRLPEKYGYGLDERCIEYPWLFANLPADARRILDAGSVLNHEFILTDAFLKGRTLHIMTLAPEANCFWKKGVSYLFDDLRAVPARDEYYDAVVCLSTLEHVGCDNTQYTRDSSGREDRPETFRDAVRELRRVLKPSGALFLSVPYGAYQHHGTFRQFDESLLAGAIAAFGEAAEIQRTFYRYSSAGWRLATAAACQDAHYVEWLAKAMREGRWPRPIPVEPDHAAAARAVACIRLVKPERG